MTRRLYTSDNIGNAILTQTAAQVATGLAGGIGQTPRTLIETTDGLTTGQMLDTDAAVVATPATATSFLTLPKAQASNVGKKIQLTLLGATAVKLKSFAASGDTINNVNASAAASAQLVAGNIYYITQVTATGWLLEGRTNLGAVATPIVPA
jgi:hypothetical protein